MAREYHLTDSESAAILMALDSESPAYHDPAALDKALEILQHIRRELEKEVADDGDAGGSGP